MTKDLFREDAYLTHCTANVIGLSDDGVILDRTVFYPAGGGQPGDRGSLIAGNAARLDVTDCRKDRQDASHIVHILGEGSPMPDVGSTLEVRIDWDRRLRLMRMHSCLHLLCTAVDGPVTGGQIGDGKGRLDFDLPEATLDKEYLTRQLNDWINLNRTISSRWITAAELDSRDDLVRTMSVRPPRDQGRVRLIEIDGIDLQACGGTHVRSTGEIGRVRVSKIEKKGRHNRRVAVVFDD